MEDSARNNKSVFAFLVKEKQKIQGKGNVTFIFSWMVREGEVVDAAALGDSIFKSVTQRSADSGRGHLYDQQSHRGTNPLSSIKPAEHPGLVSLLLSLSPC